MGAPCVLARSPQGIHLHLGNRGGHGGPVPVPPRHLCHGRPAKDHYLPDLHHMRLELEEAATPEGRAVRFGFNPLEFENFSWRGYAHLTPIQVNHAALFCLGSEMEPAGSPGKNHETPVSSGQRSDPVVSHPPQPRIVARLNVTSPDLFRLVFRYVNRGPTSVNGRVSVREESRHSICTNCEWSLLTHAFSTPYSTSQVTVDPTHVICILALHPMEVYRGSTTLGGGAAED